MEKNLETIEGDGFLFHLLHFMWLKDPMMGVGLQENKSNKTLFKQRNICPIQILEKENALKQEEEKQTNEKITLNNTPPDEQKKKCC